MISVVCVYNNLEILENRLLNSLERQNTRYDVITVDNRRARFAGAASALNHGAATARGSWVLFVHQDVALLSPDWLARAEETLERDSPTGWVGSAGRDTRGRLKCFMLDRAALLGYPFDALTEVQTLDECLLIHRRLPQGQKYFDEEAPGWHAYGVDACCDAIRAGRKNYAISLPIWHDSESTNLAGLAEAHKYVWHKHKSALGRIHTTCGTLPDFYGWETVSPTLSDNAQRQMLRLSRRIFELDEPEHREFAKALESMTVDEQVIECLHRPAPADDITATAFLPQPMRRRVVHHRFSGLGARGLESDCVVIASDLSHVVPREIKLITAMARARRRLIICVSLGRIWRRPGAWLKLLRHAAPKYLTTTWENGAPMVILQVRNEADH